MLEINHIHKRYGGLEVLSDVGFSVEAGTLTGLIGPNGAGKTTLFNILTGFQPADSGSVVFNGRDITRHTSEQRARLGLARTFQLVKPFEGMTVLENVAVGAFVNTRQLHAAQAAARRALDRVGLGARHAQMPSGLTLPDRKRMELARCLAMEPGLLLLDEVMCGLNPTDMQSMVELIKDLRTEGMTIVLVEHIMDAIAELADTVVVLSSGKVLAQGTARDVLSDQAVIEAYLGETLDHAED